MSDHLRVAFECLALRKAPTVKGLCPTHGAPINKDPAAPLHCCLLQKRSFDVAHYRRSGGRFTRFKGLSKVPASAHWLDHVPGCAGGRVGVAFECPCVPAPKKTPVKPVYIKVCLLFLINLSHGSLLQICSPSSIFRFSSPERKKQRKLWKLIALHQLLWNLG